MLVKDVGICLARSDYSETSQIATIFSRDHGKVRGIAKGSRRPKSKFGSGIELLSRGQLVFSRPRTGSGLITLTEWTSQQSYQQLRRSLQPLYRAYYLAELVDLFTEQLDPHQRLYDLFAQVLAALSANESWDDFLTFQVNLLQEVGLGPELSCCVRCGNPPKEPLAGHSGSLSFTEGGVLCPACAQAVTEKCRIKPLAIQLLRRISVSSATAEPLGPKDAHPSATADHLDGRTARQAQEALSYWIRAALNREPKTAHLLR